MAFDPSYANAIRQMESAGSGGYGALGPLTKGDRAYGAYQVMGNNVGPWTSKYYGQALSPEQFLADPAAQDAVFQGEFGSYVDRFGPGGAAQAWFGGPGSVGHAGRQDVLGTSVGDYGSRFLSLLAKSQAGMNQGQGPTVERAAAMNGPPTVENAPWPQQQPAAPPPMMPPMLPQTPMGNTMASFGAPPMPSAGAPGGSRQEESPQVAMMPPTPKPTRPPDLAQILTSLRPLSLRGV